MTYEHIERWTESGAVVIGLALVGIAALGLIGFFPKRDERENTPAGWLILAIWLGFLGNGMNAFYWNIFFPLTVHYSGIDANLLRIVGRASDLVWKTMAAVSVYLHMVARYMSIPDEEKPYWAPILMAFYPDRNHFLCRAYFGLLKKTRQPNA